MHPFSYMIKTQATPAQAWNVYTDWRLWPRFANIYGPISWSEGNPWEVGSRMRIEILKPMPTVVDHLIICCDPERELGWIDRSMGLTMSQWTEFTRLPSGGTEIRTWGDLTSPDTMIGIATAKELLATFVQTWYENYRRACDERAAQSLELAG